MSTTAPQFMFDFGSPNAFLSHEAIPAIEKRSGAKFEYVPILLGGIFKATNNKSPAETLAGVKNKREFHALETERFVKRFGVKPYVFNPFFPVNTLNMMRAAVAAQLDGIFEKYVEAAFQRLRPRRLPGAGPLGVRGGHAEPRRQDHAARRHVRCAGYRYIVSIVAGSQVSCLSVNDMTTNRLHRAVRLAGPGIAQPRSR